MASEALSVRERLNAASSRLRGVRRADRAATVVIAFGGVFVIVGVLFIFLFIAGEALPLFRPAGGRARGVLELDGLPGASAPPAGPTGPGAAGPLAIGVDEYQTYAYQVLPDARLAFFRLSDGSFVQQFEIAALRGARVTAASRSPTGDLVAAGSDDGRVALLQVRFRPRYEEQRLAGLDIEVRERGVLGVDPAGRPVRAVDYRDREGRRTVAAVLADSEIALHLHADDDGSERLATLRTRGGEPISLVRLGAMDALAAAAGGTLQLFEIAPEPRLVDVVAPGTAPLTALEWAVGGMSILAGDAAGDVTAWFRVRRSESDAELTLVRAHNFTSQGSSILSIGASARDKGFVSAGADGSLVLRHLTSERSVVAFPATGAAVERVLLAPKNDGILAQRADGRLARYELRAPHPEVSWRALFGRVWYEGYPRPEYVWQSTGASDDFEPKLSLVPLVFGTLKGTVYALLFAVPLAILAALYTSQFAHPSLKARIKPTVEIMAALPSVVIGFVAGLWLASRVEKQLAGVLLLVLLLPAFGTAGVLVWDRLPLGVRRGLKPGMELLLIVPMLAAGAVAALLAGPLLESAAFAGDLKGWLNQALGLVYDQRNSLVVGLAMGFAVIPIIFTISEDAFSSVPSHLSAASLALGASRWQTALRVVLPTASPGIFSAVMVGFGRAVGETMIVLMATGNTPLLDWSIFNGMRTLSANIAVEIPEAPQGGTLYRVLFLAGGVLFLMTFLVNTVAELVRQRLRDRYRTI